MNIQESKIDGVGVIPLRCECCYGSIVPGDGVIALFYGGAMRFLHSHCYDENSAERILERMNGISQKTKNDSEMASIMEGE